MVDRYSLAAECTISTLSAEETRQTAEAVGSRCRGGEVILLSGDLGSGKTCFVQGLARGLGVASATHVTSPTFTLHGEYSGRLFLNHLDLYRLEEPCQVEGLGIEDMLTDRQAVTAIEWPELLVSALPAFPHLAVTLIAIDMHQREIRMSAYSDAFLHLITE